MKTISVFALLLLASSSFARSPRYYSYGAIAYRTPYGPTYQIGTAEGYFDAQDAARAAVRECGNGCGHYTFYNGCSAIAYVSGYHSVKYGFNTHTEYFNGRPAWETRGAVEDYVRRKAYVQGKNVVAVFSACSNE